MREILFRGKTKENGEWVQGYFVYAKSDFDSEELREADIIPHDTDRVYKGEYNVVFPCVPETIGQFTGLSDKNGNKIFEGDIVRWDGTKISQIRYCEGVYRLCNADGYYGVSVHNHYSYIEVIGNIHDNPELLRAPQNDEVRE